MIVSDIRPVGSWIPNVAVGTIEPGTPPEVVHDRFRAVYANVTKAWERVQTPGNGCSGNPCDPPMNQLGWGADRLVSYSERQTWGTPLFCFNQDMLVTHAEQHIMQIIDDILRPNTLVISNDFIRKRHLVWAKKKWQANSHLTDFTYEWVTGGANNDEEIYFDCSVDPNDVFLLTPQALQSRFQPLMMQGYGGKNPYEDNVPFIELVSDMDTIHRLEHLGGQQGFGGVPSIAGNWRFEDWGASSKYWRYGFSGQIGNFQVRLDTEQLRFNYVTDLGAGAHSGNGNRYRYQRVLPYKNGITTGAGGAAGLGSDVNQDYLNAQFRISQIHHKLGMRLLTQTAHALNPKMPWTNPEFGGQWKFLTHDLGADVNGNPIDNKWGNKGLFGAWFQYRIEPIHYEFMEDIFHLGEQYCIPEIRTCNPDPGYPAQEYGSELPPCPLPDSYAVLDTIPDAGVMPTDDEQ